MFNSILASADFCNLLITFVNGLDPDPGSYPFDTLIVFLDNLIVFLM